jgi:hypothetical protein
MVEEVVTWFATQGSKTCDIPVRVKAPNRGVLSVLHRDEPPAGPPVMEMHCVPRQEVEAVLREAGARVRDVAELDVSGDGYQSFRYIASKGP